MNTKIMQLTMLCRRTFKSSLFPFFLLLVTVIPAELTAQVWSPVNPQAANLFNVAANNTFRLGRVTIGRNLFSAAPNDSKLEVHAGAIAQTQTAATVYGRFTVNDQWAGIGQNPLVAGIYGLGMYRNDRYGFYNLFSTTRNAVATKDLIIGFGTTATVPDANQRLLMQSFTGNAANPFNHFSVNPSTRSIGINTDNPVSTLFIDALISNSPFKSTFQLHGGSAAGAGALTATYVASGQEGNSTVNAPIFGYRAQLGKLPTDPNDPATAKIAGNFQVTGIPAAPLANNTQELEITFQDMNLLQPVGAVNRFNYQFFDRAGVFFRSGTNNPNDKRRVMAFTASGTVGINTGNLNPVTNLGGFIPIDLDMPNGGIRGPFFFIFSDSSLKKGVATITDPIGKLRRLRGTTFNYKGVAGDLDVPSYGFVAQEVKRGIPELAEMSSDGLMSVNYDGVIPILVEGVKAQSVTVATLEAQVADMAAANARLSGENDEMKTWISAVSARLGITPPSFVNTVAAPTPAAPRGSAAAAENGAAVLQSKLLQNRPNPSNGYTEFFYELKDAGTAAITITDRNGRVRKAFNNLQPGQNKVVIQKGELESGSYVYSLTINGKVADSKQLTIVQEP